MGWTGDGDVWEILKVKCWEQDKFIYLWAERVNPFGVSNALEVVVAVVVFWTVHWFLAFAFAFVGSSRSSLPATSTLKKPPCKTSSLHATLSPAHNFPIASATPTILPDVSFSEPYSTGGMLQERHSATPPAAAPSLHDAPRSLSDRVPWGGLLVGA
jgi:hypothetical protein